MCKYHFYSCALCGNLIMGQANHKDILPTCCCGPMQDLKLGNASSDAEHHRPYVHLEPGSVRIEVGEKVHPMVPDHYIECVFFLTDRREHYKSFLPGESAVAVFPLQQEAPIAAFAHCSRHGLWHVDLPAEDD
ncbi:desulfoferrodoxin [Eubacteriales bacterium OttesenSCG-928-N13]|nr:desulfoferrodoxin [Eubacteriales bacterium OttesenSCG-928-N13]